MREGGNRRATGDRGLTRRNFLLGSAGAGLFFLSPGGLRLGSEAGAADLDLEIFKGGYPRAFFFRQTEYDAQSGGYTFEEWEKRYRPLGGIMGKALDEEHEYSDRNNLSFFEQYKANNPGKAVLLHYNGAGRRPVDEATTKFFAGHWLYYKGTRLTGRAAADASVLGVEDTSVFKTNRSFGVADDVAIAVVDENGRPVWGKSEQVRLKAIDAQNKKITVERGAYGTRPRFFPPGSYLAAHVVSGPYYMPGGVPKDDFGLWNYNYSTLGPRDAQGRNGARALADYLVEKFGPGGGLSSFDGIELDVFWFTATAHQAQDVDANTDGRADGGVIDGIDTIGLGTVGFTEDLRRRLPGKIILADGNLVEREQRSFGHLNGIESEGYADVYDVDLDDVSSGENIFRFWKGNSAAPSLNYINFKYKDKQRSRNTFVEPNLSEDDSYRKVRLALASAQFTDTVFTNRGYAGGDTVWAPPETLWRQENARVQVFDELWQGLDQKPNWLGMPLHPTVLLAAGTPDLLGGEGETWPDSMIGRFSGEGVAFARKRSGTPGMSIRATGPAPRPDLAFELPGLRVTGEDLFVSLRLQAAPLDGYPASIARKVDVTAAPGGGEVRGSSFTWANGRPFTATFYFRNVGPGPVDLGFGVEGDETVYFGRLAAHSAADARYREFENGAVFANNSTRSYTFDLGTLSPGGSYRRIQGTDNQDPQANNGQPLGTTLTLGPKDALFVVRSAA